MENFWRTFRKLTLFQLLLAVACFWLTSTVYRENYTGDEGFYGTEARNMAHSKAYYLWPSSVPEGNFEKTKEALAHPPLFSMALSLGARGFPDPLLGMQSISLLIFLSALLACYNFLRRENTEVAFCALFLICVSPVLIQTFSLLEADTLLFALGMCSLALLIKKEPYFLLAGLFMGFGFATKLWLLFPFCLAALPLLFRKKSIKSALLFFFAGCLGASSHLIFISILSPKDLPFWLDKIYFGLFSGSGITGSKWVGSVPEHIQNWTHPTWYYGAIFYRDHFFLFPLFFLGGIEAWKKSGQIRWPILFGLISLIPLSLFSIKEPLYALPATIFLYLFAAVCLYTLNKKNRTFTTLFLVVTNCLLIAGFFFGLKQDDLTTTFLTGHLTVSMLFLLYLWASFSLQRCLMTASSLFLLSFIWQWSQIGATDRELSDKMRPHLENSSPSNISFIAPNYKSLQLYLFRHGMYPYETKPRDHVKLIVEDQAGERSFSLLR